jgi:flagellar protein FliS
MINSQRGAARYRSVRSHGLVADASPTRLVQIMFEHILLHLATAQGCMQRISNNRPLPDVVTKVTVIRKALLLISQLQASLNMEQGGQIAENFASLYDYMLRRMALANATNDAEMIAEVARLVGTLKAGWDQIVTDRR